MKRVIMFHVTRAGLMIGAAALLGVLSVTFFLGMNSGWNLRDSQPAQKPSLDAKLLQLHDYMKNDDVRGAWRSVYCSKETELILSSPIKQEDLK